MLDIQDRIRVTNYVEHLKLFKNVIAIYRSLEKTVATTAAVTDKDSIIHQVAYGLHQVDNMYRSDRDAVFSTLKDCIWYFEIAYKSSRAGLFSTLKQIGETMELISNLRNEENVWGTFASTVSDVISKVELAQRSLNLYTSYMTKLSEITLAYRPVGGFLSSTCQVTVNKVNNLLINDAIPTLRKLKENTILKSTNIESEPVKPIAKTYAAGLNKVLQMYRPLLNLVTECLDEYYQKITNVYLSVNSPSMVGFDSNLYRTGSIGRELLNAFVPVQKYFKDAVHVIQQYRAGQLSKHNLTTSFNEDSVQHANQILETFKQKFTTLVISPSLNAITKTKLDAKRMYLTVLRIATLMKPYFKSINYEDAAQKMKLWSRPILVTKNQELVKVVRCHFYYQILCYRFAYNLVWCCSYWE